jgi:hypothetical protein
MVVPLTNNPRRIRPTFEKTEAYAEKLEGACDELYNRALLDATLPHAAFGAEHAIFIIYIYQ